MALVVAAAMAPAMARAADDRWDAVSTAAQRLVDEGRVPGVQVCAVRSGATLYSEAFGFANLETGSPMTRESILRVGSITKTFTAVAILLLVQDGRLSLDDPLGRFYPDFPRAADFTLRRMLDHTAGLGPFPGGESAADFQVFLTLASQPHTTARMLQALAGLERLRIAEPGSMWAYSNVGYLLAGAVIEKACGLPYRQFVHERLIAPLGLEHTDLDDAAQVLPGRADGYVVLADSQPRFRHAPYADTSSSLSAGLLRSTASDLCRWQSALFSGRVLASGSLEEMLRPARLSSGELPAGNPPPDIAPPIFAGPDGRVRYGLGLFLEDPADGSPWTWHGRLVPGFMAEVRTYRATGVTWAFAVNGAEGLPPMIPPVTELETALKRAALG